MQDQPQNQLPPQIIQSPSTIETSEFQPEALLDYIDEVDPLTVAADIDRALHHYFIFFTESNDDLPGLFDRNSFTGLCRLRNAILKGINIIVVIKNVFFIKMRMLYYLISPS